MNSLLFAVQNVLKLLSVISFNYAKASIPMYVFANIK